MLSAYMARQQWMVRVRFADCLATRHNFYLAESCYVLALARVHVTNKIVIAIFCELRALICCLYNPLCGDLLLT